MFKSSLLNTDTKFNSWIVHRVKQLSNNVEADVFAMFLEGVEDPNEVCCILECIFVMNVMEK